MHLSILLWGFTGVFGRAIALTGVILVFYRLLLTVPILFLLGRWRGKIRLLPWVQWRPLVYIGFIITLHWVCFYGSIKASNISVGLSCLSTSAVFTAILEPILNRSRFKLPELLLALLSAFGMFLIFHFEKFYADGILLGLAAALLSSYFTILNKKQSTRMDSLSLSFYELASGLGFISLALPLYIWCTPGVRLVPSTGEWLLLGAFSIFCTVLPFNLSLISLRKISAFTANLSINLEPVYGMLLAFVFFKEQKELKLGFYLGSGMLLFSVVLYMLLKFRAFRNRQVATGEAALEKA